MTTTASRHSKNQGCSRGAALRQRDPASNPLAGPHTRHLKQLVWIVVAGFVLGGLLTELSVLLLPESAPRTLLTTSVVAGLEPSTLDVIGVSMTIGVGLTFNLLTLVGMGTVASVVRSWL